jgi:glycosyltransferase involved in cell wall biosynthesis
MLMVWLSVIIFFLVSALSVEVAIGARKIRHLKDIQLDDKPFVPKVSIIIPALNEAETIEPALRSVLAIAYPNLEIIVVNDRSTDGTALILERMAHLHPSLRVVQIEALPPGWLGKNHALHRGAELASGDYLLFTDADVVFEPTSIGRAVRYCEANRVGHLTLLFDIIAKTRLLAMLILSFSVNFMARFKPWKIADSKKHFLGAGGFNLVRRDAYREVGGHAAISMAVLDDLMLGKRLKQLGVRQHVLYGNGMVGVEWYRSAREMMHGLGKNAFAAFDFRLSQLVAVTLLMLGLRVWPWVALFITDGPAWWLYLLTILAGMILYIDLIRASGWNYQCLVYAPIVSLVELAIWWRGSIKTLQRGGIEWRGTFYPLSQLRLARL